MNKKTRIALLVLLVFLEVVFASWTYSPTLPRRSAELKAFWTYQNVPTQENYDRWMRERGITLHEIRLRKSIGIGLALSNLLVIAWLIRMRQIPQTGLDQ